METRRVVILWGLILIFGLEVLSHEDPLGKLHEDIHPKISSNSTTSGESPETIQSLNTWVRIPDWKNSNPPEFDDDFEGTSSSTDPFFHPPPSSSEFRSTRPKSHGSSAVLRDSDDNFDEEEDPEGPEPFFDHHMMTNISEQLGNHAFLRCRVKNLGDRTVSWIKLVNHLTYPFKIHIISSGRITYTNDDRFQIMHTEGSDEWALVIKYVQLHDSATYSCEVNGRKTTISHYFNLIVLVPQAYILGAKEYHLQPGTLLTLVCIIENAMRSPPQYLYWYHNNQMLNLGSGGISVHTEPGIHTHSRLTIHSGGHQHAGNYSCKTQHATAATVQVFVSDGDTPAAIQGGNGSNFVPPYWTILSAVLLHFLRLLRHAR